jgi:hypothetical protein
MIQLIPQLKILLACQPVDFRKGIDSLVALCQAQLAARPFLRRPLCFSQSFGHGAQAARL